MPTVLNKTILRNELLPLVFDFNCAEHEPAEIWEDEINEWIRLDPSTGDGALHWMTKGTQVWLYTNEKDEVVGYGSLGRSKWPDPAIVEKLPKITRVPITLLPAVGIDRKFHGRPDGAIPQEKYSTKIMNHLISEAAKHIDRQPFLGLFVHPKNEKAIRLYRRMHFEDFSVKCWNERAGVDYPSMILKLAR